MLTGKRIDETHASSGYMPDVSGDERKLMYDCSSRKNAVDKRYGVWNPELGPSFCDGFIYREDAVTKTHSHP